MGTDKSCTQVGPHLTTEIGMCASRTTDPKSVNNYFIPMLSCGARPTVPFFTYVLWFHEYPSWPALSLSSTIQANGAGEDLFRCHLVHLFTNKQQPITEAYGKMLISTSSYGISLCTTLYFLFIVLRSVQVQSGSTAVQWVSRVWIRQQLRQKRLEYIGQIYTHTNTHTAPVD